jgi:hypothetical protein
LDKNPAVRQSACFAHLILWIFKGFSTSDWLSSGYFTTGCDIKRLIRVFAGMTPGRVLATFLPSAFALVWIEAAIPIHSRELFCCYI